MVRAHRGGGDVAGTENPTACKTKQPVGESRTWPGCERLKSCSIGG